MCMIHGGHGNLISQFASRLYNKRTDDGLKQRGKQVVIVEMAPDLSHLRISAGAVAMELTSWIQRLKIPVYFNCRLEEIVQDAIVCRGTQTSEQIGFPADTVLLALGMSARQDAADSLRRSAPETEVFVVGDAQQVGTIASAVMSGFKAAAYV
ncbi:MAG: hypothetical protein P8Z37_05225 [Acidobacteriota bacterium]